MALFQMGPDKAAGLDGFIPRFFQQFWSVVGTSVCKYVQDIFQRGVINVEENQTLICLIPKVKQPEFLSQFHPIALCKVLIKVVMKILANRLKVLMPKLTGEHRTSFVSS